VAYAPYLIAQYEPNSGLNTYSEPFLIPEKAFQVLEDAYCWRGRIKRRRGNKLLGRLTRYASKLPLAVTIAGNYAVADVLASVRATEANAEIQVGSVTIVISRGNADQTTYIDSLATPGVLTMVAGGTYTISAGTINYITGAISLTFTVAPGAGLTVDISLYYAPGLPCMGLKTYDRPEINIEKLVAFDTKYAYEFDFTLNQFIELTGSAPTTWTGSDSDLFWATNYFHDATGDLFWATNNNAGADPIRYYNGTTWTTFNPLINAAADRLQQCLALLPFKDRLVAFNTWEGANLAGAVNYRNRVRWSQNGSPLMTTGLEWLDDTVGRGGWLNAPTEEQIVSVEYLKDVLLVKFERSSWRLVYTGNEALPFVFQKINTELGAESTFSIIPFDDAVFSIGDLAITSDDTTSVKRIDLQIPNQVFSIANFGEEVRRVYGIRDYITELVYWAFPDNDLISTGSPKFNNHVLVYNYRNQTYSRFKDSYTCFGTFQSPVQIVVTSVPYAPETIAGNQQGFVTVMNQQTLNGNSRAIKAITAGTPVTITSVNHNFDNVSDHWITINGINGLGPNNPSALNYTTSGITYHIKTVLSADTFTLQYWNTAVTPHAWADVTLAAGGTYIGGGEIQVVQNFDIQTKIFAPYYDNGMQAKLGYVDFLLDTTVNGQVICNVYINENDTNGINDPLFPTNFGLLGSNCLNTFADNPNIPGQANWAKIWHRVFVGSISQNYWMQLKMNNDQMSRPFGDPAIPTYGNAFDFVLHAMTMYVSAGARMT